MSNLELWRAWEGRVVDGKFPLRQFLGASDHSAVFLTERQGDKAAIKLIAAGAKDSDRQLARWQAAAQLSHPHLLHIFESGCCQFDGRSQLYVLMEFADEDLSQILPERALTPAEVGDMLPPVLVALSYLHGKGLVHHRITPSNIHAVGDQLKLAADHVVSAAEIIESVRRDVYDPPESAAGVASPAGDMWALGATLLATLLQRVPFSTELSDRDPVVPQEISEPFRGIARECLHLDPKRRCSIAQMQARLEPRARSVPAEPELAPAQKSSKKRIPIFGLVVALVVVGLIFFFTRKGSSPAIQEQQPAQQSSQAGQPAPAPSSTPASSTAQAAQRPSNAGSVLKKVVPDVPASARSTITGKVRVTVQVEVDSSGKVTATKLTSPGPSRYFANLALKSARDWEFAPPEVDGQPGASSWLLHFRFGRTGTEVSADREHSKR
jgi:TonB family protein